MPAYEGYGSDVKIFRLDEGGSTAKTAQDMQRFMESLYQIAAIPITGRNLADIHKDFTKLHHTVFIHFQQSHPELMAKLGLTSPSIHISYERDNFPRAYRMYPAIYEGHDIRADEAGNKAAIPIYYMYAPVGYDGAVFIPPDAREVTGDEINAVGDMLFAGGWGDPSNVLPITQEGVALPAYFDEAKHFFQHNAHDYGRPHIFLANGQTLDLIKNFETRKELYQRATSAFMQTAEAFIRANPEEFLTELPPDAEGFYINYSYREENRRPVFTMSVRRDGKTDIMAAGRPLPLRPDNPGFYAIANAYGECAITPKKRTKTGHKLRSLYSALPYAPSLNDYADFRAMAAPSLRHERVNDLCFLICRSDEVNDTTTLPPDTTPVDVRLYNWLRHDAGDRNGCIKPPPMPDDIKVMLAAISSAPLHHPCRAPTSLPCIRNDKS